MIWTGPDMKHVNNTINTCMYWYESELRRLWDIRSFVWCGFTFTLASLINASSFDGHPQRHITDPSAPASNTRRPSPAPSQLNPNPAPTCPLPIPLRPFAGRAIGSPMMQIVPRRLPPLLRPQVPQQPLAPAAPPSTSRPQSRAARPLLYCSIGTCS